MRACAECNANFEPYISTQRFCCVECQQTNILKKRKYKNGYGADLCRKCNSVFDKNVVNQKFCSAACRKEFYKYTPQNYGVGECSVCSKKFSKKHTDMKYCSVDCRNVVADKIKKEGVEFQDKQCYYCKDTFTPKRRHQQYCNLNCKKRSWLKCSKTAIYKRDRFRCFLCGQSPMNKDMELKIVRVNKKDKFRAGNVVSVCSCCFDDISVVDLSEYVDYEEIDRRNSELGIHPNAKIKT